MTERKEIQKEEVFAGEKIFSIYEQHTDIIVKGWRDVKSEKGISNTAMQLERFCTLWTEDTLECYWL